jgi:AcrR family transcriptional regulator
MRQANARGKGGRPTAGEASLIEGRILDVARSQFFGHGYGATSIDTIARLAGISKRTFYARFANKAALFRAVVNRLVLEITPPNSAGLFQGGEIGAVLSAIAQALLEASLSPQAIALQRLLIAEAARFPELGIAMSGQGARHGAIEAIAKLLALETEAGRLTVRDPALSAELFLHMVIGTPQRRALGLGVPMTRAELDDWSKLVVHTFLQGCQARPEADHAPGGGSGGALS